MSTDAIDTFVQIISNTVTSPPPSGSGLVTNCRLWKGPFVGSGYGSVPRGVCESTLAHRAVLNSLGHDLEGFQVLHKCDRPACVEPTHLEVGTPMENLRQAAARGRTSGSVLTEDDVVEMREAYAAGGVTQAELSGRYQISQAQVSKILTGSAWCWAGGPIQPLRKRKGSVSESDRDRAIALAEQGLSIARISLELGISHDAAHRTVTRAHARGGDR